MASHVSDTERAIFWTKWRFQQCYRNAGNSENLGIIYKNTSVKKKLIILATISVFILFFLKTRLLRKPNESKLTLETLEEDNSFDDKPEIDFKNKINVNEQQDRIKAEKFEANDFVGGFGDEKVANDIEENKGFGEDSYQDGKNKNKDPIIPVLQPPSDIKDDVNESFDIKLNDQVPMPEIKGKNDTKTEEETIPESNLDQKKKIQNINEVDQDLKAGENKKKKKKPLQVGKVKKGKKKDKENNLKGSVIKNTFPSLANNDTFIKKDLNSDIEKKGMKKGQDMEIDSKILNGNENIETTKEIEMSLANIASYMNGTKKEAELVKGNKVDDKIKTEANPTSDNEVVEDDKASEGEDKPKNTKKKRKKDKKTKLKSNKDSETEESLERKPKINKKVDDSETKDRKRKKKFRKKNKNIKGKKKALKTKTNLSNKNIETEETMEK